MKQQRPLEDKEIAILDAQLVYLDKSRKRQIWFLITWTSVALIVGVYKYPGMESTALKLLLLGVIIVYIGIGVRVTTKIRLRQKKFRTSVNFLKNKNLVTAVNVESDLYCELEEREDQGVYYLFQLSDNKVFSFGGQNFYKTDDFPSNKFEIVEGRGIDDELVLQEIFVYGKKITPTHIISGQDKWNLLNHPNYPDPEELTVVDGRMEDYLKMTEPAE